MADYGLLFQSLPQFQPQSFSDGVLKGMERTSAMNVNQQNADSQTKQVDSQAQYQQEAINKIKQEMNFDQLNLTNKLLSTVTDPATYQNFLMQVKKAGLDISDMPKSYDEQTQAWVKQAAQLSGTAKAQMEAELLQAQTANQQAQAARALRPDPLTNSNTVQVTDQASGKTMVVPTAQAVEQGLTPTPKANAGTAVINGRVVNIPTGFTATTDPKTGEPMLKALPHGPADKQNIEDAGKAAGLQASQKDFDIAKNLFMPDGQINRVIIGTANGVPGIRGVPFSQGREARQAMERVITNHLRVVSGAAIQNVELARYMDLYLPQLGDSDASIQNKFEAMQNWMRSARLRVDGGKSDAIKDDDMYQQARESLKAVQDTSRLKVKTDLEATAKRLGLRTPTDADIDNYIKLQGQRSLQQQDAEKKNPEINGANGMLGDTTKKYESGNTGAATVSSGKGDPGGASYGTYQLSSKAGTLNTFLKWTGYDKDFKGLTPGTPAFNAKWKEMATNNTQFANAEHAFIEKNNYAPVASVAKDVGIPQTPRIAEAIWSMSVQHGKADTLVRRAAALTQDKSNENEVLKNLYKVRRQYVMSLSSLPFATKKSILARYDNEENDVLKMA